MLTGGISLGLGVVSLAEKFGWLARFIPEQQESKERLDDWPRNILVIDFPAGTGEGIPEEGLANYLKIEQEAFADMPEKFLSRQDLVALLNEQRTSSQTLTVDNLEDPSPDLLRSIAEIGYPELAVWYTFLQRYRTHGQSVATAAQTSWDVTRESGQQRLLSLGEFLTRDTVDFHQDQWGNSGLSAELHAAQLIPRIEQYLGEHPEFLDDGVVNLSLQMGKIESWVNFRTPDETYPNQPILRSYSVSDLNLYLILPRADVYNILTPHLRVVAEEDGRYVILHEDPNYPEYTKEYVAYVRDNFQAASDELDLLREQYAQEFPEESSNPGTHEVGAYTGEDRREHLQELVSVADAFPELFFCAAAGNNADDLSGLSEIGVEIPENLMIVGQWSTTYNPPRPAFETKGAEIYISNDVPAELLGGKEDDVVRLGNGSSFSTPQISGIVSTLRGLGIPIEQIKPLLFEMAEIKRYPVDRRQETSEPSEEARVLSLQRVQEVITALRTAKDSE